MSRSRRILVVVLVVAGCSVAAAPAQGAIIPGVYPGGVNGQPGNYGQIDRMNAWQQRRNTVINVFGADPAATLAQMLLVWNNYKAIPMVSWGPAGPNSSRAGNLETEHLALGHMLRTFVVGPDLALNTADDRRVYLRYAWEPNVPSHPWSPYCGLYQGTGQQYIDAWRKAHSVISPLVGGRTRVAWVYSVNSKDVYASNDGRTCYSGASLYPGDAYVDWVGMSAYDDGCSPTSPANEMGTQLSALRAKTSRPVGIQEAGVTHVGPGRGVAYKDNWIQSYWDYLAANDIRMSVWFNADKTVADNCADFEEPWDVFGGNQGTETFTFQGASYKAYTGYRVKIQQAALVAVNGSNPRLLTDSQFLGQ